MLLRRMGETVQGVQPHFDSRALTEIGFHRTRDFSMKADEFDAEWEKVEDHELTAATESSVQDEGEAALLDELEGKLRGLLDGLGEDQALVVENSSTDYPKTKDRKQEVVVEGRNRLHFHWRVEPPLKVGVYRRTGS